MLVLRKRWQAQTRITPLLGLAGLLVLVAAGPAPAQDVPTGGPPSPLFGAADFSQQMLRFEEFGRDPLPANDCPTCLSLPAPSDTQSAPSGPALDAFLLQPLSPLPMPQADVGPGAPANPWQSVIETMTGPLAQTYADGRPPGPLWGHQRWDEFFPQEYFHSAQAGARLNSGFRDHRQRHGYAIGEFGPGGLYHNTTGAGPASDGTTAGINIRFHPNIPLQDHKSLWTFDGTLPPKLLMARYGKPILFRHYNALPIDPGANQGFGLHTISSHEHNGHNPAESDGFTSAFFFPGQYYDYRWPMALAGHDSINTDATDPRAARINDDGSTTNIPGDWRETMSTHWFHDHMLDFTAQNVYKGNAVMMNYYSAIDRGHENVDCHYVDPSNVNLCFPSGTALEWGNRDYDVNLLVADKAWDAAGQLWFNIFNLDGFLGDRMTVNWLYKPYFEVRARRYRFRILNGSVSRYFKIAIVDEDGNRVPYHMVANDGNIMGHAIPFPNAESQDLPTQSIAERYDIIIDFAAHGIVPGDKLYMVNLLEHDDGKRPEGAVSIADALAGNSGDPAVGAFFEMRVVAYGGTDTSMDPSQYEPGGKSMIPQPVITAAEVATARHRTFEFGRSSGTDEAPWTIKTDGGRGLGMDPARQSAAPDPGALEIWHIENGGGGWSHPIHVHFEEGRILQRGGEAPPIWERFARKDVYRVGNMPDSTDEVVVALRFREFLGTYMEHCHNTQHEDHAMLLRWDIETGDQIAMPAPAPAWDGVSFEETFKLETAKIGDVDAAADWDPTIGVDDGPVATSTTMEPDPPVSTTMEPDPPVSTTMEPDPPVSTTMEPEEPECGDVDGDGHKGIRDALKVAQYQVGLRGCDEFEFYQLGDVDDDDDCTIIDALRIAQCDVGLIGCDFVCGVAVCD